MFTNIIILSFLYMKVVEIQTNSLTIIWYYNYKGCEVMKIPKYATLLLNRNVKFPIEKIHFETKQVTLREKQKVYNTVSVKNVSFDYSDLTITEIACFKNALKI